jgi:hypothetical protein
MDVLYEKSDQLMSKRFRNRQSYGYDGFHDNMGEEFTVPKPAWGDNAFLQIEGFQNFLASAAEVQLNQRLSPDGTSLFDLNLKDYSSLLVVIESEDQVAHLIVPV